jgi:hypothetical protein
MGALAGALAVALAICLGLAAADSPDLSKLAGLYRYTFQNGLVNGKKYRSENKLELLPLGATSAYFHTHLEWANGHSCDLAGVAGAAPDGSLEYRKPSLEGQTCLFRIRVTKDGLMFEDEGGACRMISCGARGMLDGVEFKFRQRSVLNAEAVQKSDEFQQAVEEHSRQTKGRGRE